MDSKVLLITKNLKHSPIGGREMLSKLNNEALNLILGHRLMVMELRTFQHSRFRKFICLLKGHIDGINTKTINLAIKLIRQNNIKQIFIDGSNLGAIVEVLKRSFPNVEVITFFHNVESRFFWGSFRLNKTFHAFSVLVANYLAERKSVKNSDIIICLSNRDSYLLKRLYGRAATHVSPIALRDSYLNEQIASEKIKNIQYAVFVGGNFYANREGILWFVKHVVPLISVKVYVVGAGMDQLRSLLEIAGRVEVVGAVEDVAAWYREALFVIAPIFDGSGMKTKVAEALMYGKKVVGTAEAFSGYEEVASKIGWCCHDATSFADSISAAQQSINLQFDPEMRKIYEERYSLEAATLRFAKIFSSEG